MPPSTGPLPVTPLRTGAQVQLRQEAPRQLRPRLPSGLAALRGRADCGLLGARLRGAQARAQRGGPGRASAGRKVLLRRSELARGAGSRPPGQSRVRTPTGLYKLEHAAGTPWAAVSLHRTQQSHRQGFLGQETQLCLETDTLLTLLASGSRQRGHEIAGSCARGPPGSGALILSPSLAAHQGLT